MDLNLLASLAIADTPSLILQMTQSKQRHAETAIIISFLSPTSKWGTPGWALLVRHHLHVRIMPVLLVCRERPATGGIWRRHVLVLLRVLVLAWVVVRHRGMVDWATRIIRWSARGPLRWWTGGHRCWNKGSHLWRSRHWFNLPCLSWLWFLTLCDETSDHNLMTYQKQHK
jgi:hypothetical protein